MLPERSPDYILAVPCCWLPAWGAGVFPPLLCLRRPRSSVPWWGRRLWAMMSFAGRWGRRTLSTAGWGGGRAVLGPLRGAAWAMFLAAGLWQVLKVILCCMKVGINKNDGKHSLLSMWSCERQILHHLTPIKHELKKKTTWHIHVRCLNTPKVEGDGERDLFPDLDIDDRGLLFGSTASCKWERNKQCTHVMSSWIWNYCTELSPISDWAKKWMTCQHYMYIEASDDFKLILFGMD